MQLAHHTSRFSVCIPTFNGAHFIKEQLLSVIALLGEHDEVIVLDDCSSDNTLEILNSIEFPRLVVLQNDKNCGLLSSIERLIELSRGSYIILADQDDIWLPNRISAVLDLLECGVDFVVTDAVVVNSEREVIADSYFKKVRISNSFIKNFYKCGILGCCIAFNRKLVSTALPFPKNQLIPHDLWLYLIAKITHSKIVINQQKCILYRRHTSSVTSAGFRSNRSFSKKLWARFILAKYLMQRVIQLWISSY